MKAYKINIIDGMNKWEGMSSQWNDLLSQSSANTIFLTWEWLRSWAECFFNNNRKLFIILVYRDNELVGVAPFYIQYTLHKFFTLKQIEFLGAPEAGSDYLDVFIKKGQEKDVTSCIYDFLLKEVPSMWDCLLLRDIPADSLFLLYFLNKIEEEGKYAEVYKGSFCPTVSLPRTEKDFFLGLSSNRREQFRRHLRILEREADMKYSIFRSRDVEDSLNVFFDLYEKKKTYDGEQLFSFLKKFISRSGEKDRVQIDMLTCHGKNVAGLLHLKYRGILSMYLMAVDKTFNSKISVGNILVGLSLKQTVNQGIPIYDFLKGAEDYKFHWANTGRSSINIFYYQKKVMPLLLAMSKFVKYSAKIILR
jgi:hypothetical protein